jgi:Domain of Unknown Function (DUF1206)
MTESTTRASDKAEQAADSPWLRRAARLGLAARGLVYLVIGFLAIEIASGGSARSDQEGALRKIAEQPLGRTMLWLVAVGFVAYGVWNLGEGIWGRREENDEKKRTVKRIGSVAIAVVYVGLCVTAIRVATGTGGGSSNSSYSARLLDAPGGKTIMVILGVVLMGAAVVLAWRGLKTDFEKHLNSGQMGRTTYAVVRRLGQVGYLARGAVVGLVGWLVLQAALTHEPHKAGGVDVALKSLVDQPFGRFVLLAVALGLICFGAYSFAEMRYRRL